MDKKLRVSNIFKVSPVSTILSIESIKELTDLNKYKWSITLNNEKEVTIKHLYMIILKGKSKKLENQVLETDEDLSFLEELDFIENEVFLIGVK